MTSDVGFSETRTWSGRLPDTTPLSCTPPPAAACSTSVATPSSPAPPEPEPSEPPDPFAPPAPEPPESPEPEPPSPPAMVAFWASDRACNVSASLGTKVIASAAHIEISATTAIALVPNGPKNGRWVNAPSAPTGAPALRAVMVNACRVRIPKIRGFATVIRPRTRRVSPGPTVSCGLRSRSGACLEEVLVTSTSVGSSPVLVTKTATRLEATALLAVGVSRTLSRPPVETSSEVSLSAVPVTTAWVSGAIPCTATVNG